MHIMHLCSYRLRRLRTEAWISTHLALTSQIGNTTTDENGGLGFKDTNIDCPAEDILSFKNGFLNAKGPRE